MKKRAVVKKIILCAAFALFAVTLLPAEYNHFGIPDSAEIRKLLVNSWYNASLNQLRTKSSVISQALDGTKFETRLEETDEEFAVVTAPQVIMNVELIKENGKETVERPVYPGAAPGSFVVYKNKKTSKTERIIWYFNQDSDVYLQFTESENKTLADLMIFGACACRSVPLGIPFEKLYTMSFENLYNITQRKIPWKNVIVTPGIYFETLQMAAIIRENLPRIQYAEYGCYNKKGELYSFMTGKPLEILKVGDFSENKNDLYLDSAGFLKWITDGIIKPYTGVNSDIDKMLQSTVEYHPLGKNGILSRDWNLSFTLNWTRNLAAEALSARSSKTYSYAESMVDVTVEPFASEIKNSQLVNSAGYIKNTGYQIDKLKSLMYILAVNEPAYCYFGAIRQQSESSAEEMVFNECAAFFPFFDDNGRFGCYVFENGKEMTLEIFCKRYENCFIHLERLKCDETFAPQ